MKTFRWTIPTPSLSGVEKREHRLYERKKGIKAQASKYDTIEVEPQNWRERWALYKLNKNRMKKRKEGSFERLVAFGFSAASVGFFTVAYFYGREISTLPSDRFQGG